MGVMLKTALRLSRLQKFRNLATAATNTIDKDEVQHFGKFAVKFWDEFGVMKPLHSMNKLRIPLVRDGLLNTGAIDREKSSSPVPLKGLSILDVGCGVGILAEPLARLGANVTGIDGGPDIIQQAKSHSEVNNLEINYITCSIEDHASDQPEKYDAIVASEVLEHVSKKEAFLEASIKSLKPGGSIFITTMNKTLLANIAGVFIAENVLNLLPKGTHQFEKFIEPVKLQRLLTDQNCRTELIHGMIYNILTNTWHWSSDTSINYAIQAVKLKQI